MRQPENLIAVTRHLGALEWLERQGITPVRVIHRVRHVNQIEGKNIVGVLPHSMIFRPNIFGQIVIPYNRLDRYSDFSCQELIELGAYLRWYKIQPLRFLDAEPLPNEIARQIAQKLTTHKENA